MDLGKLTALQLAEKIKQHQISVLDGVKYVFDQIEAKEDKVHAYLDTYKKEAYARAKEVQKGISTPGRARISVRISCSLSRPGVSRVNQRL